LASRGVGKRRSAVTSPDANGLGFQRDGGVENARKLEAIGRARGKFVVGAVKVPENVPVVPEIGPVEVKLLTVVPPKDIFAAVMFPVMVVFPPTVSLPTTTSVLTFAVPLTLAVVTDTFVIVIVPLLIVTFANVMLLSVVTVLPNCTAVLPIVIGAAKLSSSWDKGMAEVAVPNVLGTGMLEPHS
jgi:hypothetical protein